MSAEASMWAYRAVVLDPAERLILILLANNADDTGFGKLPDHRDIAGFAMCALDDVPGWLRGLMVSRHLTVKSHKGKDYFELNTRQGVTL